MMDPVVWLFTGVYQQVVPGQKNIGAYPEGKQTINKCGGYKQKRKKRAGKPTLK